MPTTLVSATQLLGNPLVLLETSMPPCESACFFPHLCSWGNMWKRDIWKLPASCVTLHYWGVCCFCCPWSTKLSSYQVQRGQQNASRGAVSLRPSNWSLWWMKSSAWARTESMLLLVAQNVAHRKARRKLFFSGSLFSWLSNLWDGQCRVRGSWRVDLGDTPDIRVIYYWLMCCRKLSL